MSYLDALRQASEQQKAAEIAENVRLENLHARFQQEVKPALEMLYSSLNELVKHLNYLKTTISLEYRIRGCEQGVELLQQEYTLTVFRDLQLLTQRNYKNKPAEVTQDNDFSLCFKAIGQKAVRIEKLHALDTKLQRDYLEEFNLDFKVRETLDPLGNVTKTLFLIEPEIPMEFRFTNDLENSTIDLTVTNFSELGQRIYVIKPEEVTHAFVDELAKYLSRQPNKLALKSKPLGHGKLPPRGKKSAPTTPPATAKTPPTPKPAKQPEQDLEEFQQWLSTQTQKIASEQETKPASKSLLGTFFSKLGLGRAK